MPEIRFTRDTGSYTKGATVDMGAGTAAYLVEHGAAEYASGATKPKRAAPKAKPTPPAGKGTPDNTEGTPTPE